MISQILGGVMLAYLGAGFLFLAAILWSSPRLKSFALGLLGGGLAAHTLAFFARWVASYLQAAAVTPPAGFWAKLQLIVYQAPLSNFYDSLVFFAWCVAILSLIFLRRYAEGFLGVVGGLLASLVLAYASLGVDSRIKPLMPALKSNWLLVHVITCFLGYAAFGIAFGAALLYLIQSYGKRSQRPGPPPPGPPALPGRGHRLHFPDPGDPHRRGVGPNRLGALLELGPQGDRLPRSPGSFTPRLLHARLVQGWQGRPIAWLAVTGFGAVLFTYLGVSFLLPGLHSYLS